VVTRVQPEGRRRLAPFEFVAVDLDRQLRDGIPESHTAEHMRRSLIATTVAALFPRRNRGGRPAESGGARARPIARRDQARGVSAGRPRRARHLLRDLPRLSAPDVVLHVPAVRQARSRRRVHGGRVSGVYTLWRPAGWHAPHKLGFGSSVARRHRLTGASRTVTCKDYEALVQDSAHARTAYYLLNGRLWGFGLFRRGASPCR
jgi:hypothetical protein